MGSYKVRSDRFEEAYTSLKIIHTDEDGVQTTVTDPTLTAEGIFTINGEGFAGVVQYALLKTLVFSGGTFSGNYDLEETAGRASFKSDFETWATGNIGSSTATSSVANNIVTVTLDLPVANTSFTATADIDSNYTRTYSVTTDLYYEFTNLDSGLHTFEVIATFADNSIKKDTFCTFIDNNDELYCQVAAEDQLSKLDYYLLEQGNSNECNCVCDTLRTIWINLQAKLEDNCDGC